MLKILRLSSDPVRSYQRSYHPSGTVRSQSGDRHVSCPSSCSLQVRCPFIYPCSRKFCIEAGHLHAKNITVLRRWWCARECRLASRFCRDALANLLEDVASTAQARSLQTGRRPAIHSARYICQSRVRTAGEATVARGCRARGGGDDAAAGPTGGAGGAVGG